MATVVFDDTFSSVASWHGANAAVTLDSTHVYTGSNAMKVVTSNVAAAEGVDRSANHPVTVVSDLIAVDPDSTYLVEAWVYGNASGATRILWDNYTSTPTYLSTVGLTAELTVPATFTKYSFKVTTPSTAAYVNPRFLTSTSQAFTYWVGRVTITKLSDNTARSSIAKIVSTNPGKEVSAVGNTATRPTPPSSYTLPGGLTSVSTSSDLLTKLASSTVQNIVLEDGTYTKGTSGNVTIGAAHKVYARNLLGATIKFGMAGGQFANCNGLTFQGIAFNVSDTTRIFSGGDSGILVAWASGSNHWNLLDCTFTGTDSITNGLSIQANACYEGLVIQRCEFHNFHHNGARISTNDTSYVPTTPPLLEDIYTVNCVHATDAQGSNGVEEAGIWLGCKATINRLWCHQDKGYAVANTRSTQKAWQGLWIGASCRGSTFSDILVTGFIAFGIYGFGPLNAGGESITIDRLETHWPVNVGHHQEWNHGVGNNTKNVTVQNSYIESQCVGVHYDQGTASSTCKSTTFVGQASACLNDYLPGTPANFTDTTGNDYTGRLVGCAINSSAYVTSFPLWNIDGGPGE